MSQTQFAESTHKTGHHNVRMGSQEVSESRTWLTTMKHLHWREQILLVCKTHTSSNSLLEHGCVCPPYVTDSKHGDLERHHALADRHLNASSPVLINS